MTKETAIKGKLFSFGVFYQPQVCEREWRKESDFLRHFSRQKKIIRKSLVIGSECLRKIFVSGLANNKLKTEDESFERDDAWRRQLESARKSRASVETLLVVSLPASAPSALLRCRSKLIWISSPSFVISLPFSFDVKLINESESKEQFSVFLCLSFVWFVDSQKRHKKVPF